MPTLYVVATPIGNLGDMTPRAVETLKNVGLIAAEDTRTTQKLLSVFGIATPMTSCHEHNEKSKAARIVRRMVETAMDVALTTDAGTPCISDPGSLLVREAVQAGLEVLAVPGPAALTAALSVSGVPVEEFTFYGFLPRGKGELKDKLHDMRAKSKAAVVHESPHRVADLLRCIREALPNTYVCCSCDLTKRFERTLRGPVSEVLGAIENNPKAEKGEYCLVLVWGKEDRPEPPDGYGVAMSLEARLFDGLVGGLCLRESMDQLIGMGEKKNAVYAASLRLKDWMGER
ncbi:MAG: 16S rRNA (cytidine(1402)-2'-O)-methyltransferase [Clostridia bacterium]|nr:16S rRNA (cytidine(1402)-2'-O)-methyltransferase [Clostridia bacterium]